MDWKTIIVEYWIPALIAAITCVGTSSADENSCLDLSYCNLIKGDLARESEKYNKDPSKFYKDAEQGVTLYHKYVQQNDTNVAQECERLTDTCTTEASKMAVEDLNFPSKYREMCDYKSYSRTLFDCGNIKKWPVSIKDFLPKESKICRSQCIITNDTNFTLSTGKVVNTLQTDVLPAGDPEIDAMETEQRLIDTNRKLTAEFTVYEEDDSRSDWRARDVCPDGTWGFGPDHIVSGDHLDAMYLRCNRIEKGVINRPDQAESSVWAGSLKSKRTPPGIKGTSNHYYRDWAKHCGDVPKRPGAPDSFLVGVSFKMKQFRIYGKVPLYTNFICGTSIGWTYPRQNNNIDKEFLCPVGSAVCSVQAKVAPFESFEFITNIRVGCCEGDKNYPSLFQTNVTNEPTPSPNTTTTTSLECPGAEEIQNLQKRSSSYFIFWDESEVLNDIITRYNIYYSPAQLPNEDQCKAGMCKPGEFLGSYEVRDPKSCYFQGRRIPEIRFNCSSKDGKKGEVLDLYGELKNGHTLQDSKFFDSKDCVEGIYTGMELTYYVNKEYPYLVNAWGIKMKCSSGGSTSDQEIVIKAYSRLNLAAHGTEKAAVNCEAGKAICGFQTKIADKHDGVFEGLYFKVICCAL